MFEFSLLANPFAAEWLHWTVALDFRQAIPEFGNFEKCRRYRDDGGHLANKLSFEKSAGSGLPG
jgi:hypothetical protein